MDELKACPFPGESGKGKCKGYQVFRYKGSAHCTWDKGDGLCILGMEHPKGAETMTDYKKERKIAEAALPLVEKKVFEVDGRLQWVIKIPPKDAIYAEKEMLVMLPREFNEHIAMAHPARYLRRLDTIQDQVDTIEKLKNFVTMFDRWYSSKDGDEKGLSFPNLKKARLALNDWCNDWTPRGEKE